MNQIKCHLWWPTSTKWATPSTQIKWEACWTWGRRIEGNMRIIQQTCRLQNAALSPQKNSYSSSAKSTKITFDIQRYTFLPFHINPFHKIRSLNKVLDQASCFFSSVLTLPLELVNFTLICCALFTTSALTLELTLWAISAQKVRLFMSKTSRSLTLCTTNFLSPFGR